MNDGKKRELEYCDDSRHYIDDDSPLPDGPAIVSLARWVKSHQELSHRTDVGVFVANTVDINSIASLLQCHLLVLEFPGFADGRAFSQARKLRDRGYTGSLRARGTLLPADQANELIACGFNQLASDCLIKPT